MAERKRQYRQGDVFLESFDGEVKSLPHKVVPRDGGRVVLAYGEATGHAHAVEEAEAELIELESGERFLVTPRGISLRHEEHDTIHLPPGTYRVVRQREYVPPLPGDEEDDEGEDSRYVLD